MASAQDLVNQGFHGYSGWGDAEASADFAATGGAGKGGGGGTPTSGGGDIQAQIQKAIEIQKQAAQPFIESQKAAIPETKERFEQARGAVKGKESNLKSRYDAILGELKGKEEKVVEQQELATTREFGKRGFLPSSGVVEQQLVDKTSGIRQDFGNITRQTALDRESGLLDLSQILASLTGEETQSLRDIQNTIGQTQIRASEFGAQQGLGVAGQTATNQQNAIANLLQQAQFGEQKRESGISEALNQALFAEQKRATGEAERLARIQEARLGADDGDGGDETTLQEIFGGGLGFSAPSQTGVNTPVPLKSIYGF